MDVERADERHHQGNLFAAADHFGRNREQRGIIGCSMAFWRDDVLAVNGFDEAFLGRGIGPDSDLGTRVYNLGRSRKFVYGRAIVYHLDHPVMPRDNLAAKKLWLQETIRSGAAASWNAACSNTSHD